MAKFRIELVTSRPVAQRLLDKADIERIKIEKKLGTSIIKSYTTSQSLSNKLEDKAEWESKLAKAISDISNLAEGPAKDRAKVDKQEFEWRLNRFALDDQAENPEEIVWSEVDKAIALANLPIVSELITELTAHKATLPE
jgi:hypothetical protein